MNTARHAMEILPLVVILMVLSMWSFPRNEVQRLELVWKEGLVDHSNLECMLLTTWIDAQSHYSRIL